MAQTYAYTPQYAVPPGATLKETLETIGMSQKELSTRTGLTEKTISQIVAGKDPISFETARKLEQVLGVPARMWNNLERNYREANAAARARERMKGDVSHLALFPLRELIERGYLAETSDRLQQFSALLAFFGVADWNAWEEIWSILPVQFRKSTKSKRRELIATWLRVGELEAAKRTCDPFDAHRFSTVLQELRRLTDTKPELFLREIETRCAKAGAAVVFVPEFKGAGVSGATRWLNPSKALIQISFRFKTDDQFWFTFFHEACHVLRHGRKEVFVEAEGQDDEKEEQANRFAANILIPPSESKHLARMSTEAEILAFARRINVAPGIVVGRMQHDGYLSYRTTMNKLKRSVACGYLNVDCQPAFGQFTG